MTCGSVLCSLVPKGPLPVQPLLMWPVIFFDFPSCALPILFALTLALTSLLGVLVVKTHYNDQYR